MLVLLMGGIYGCVVVIAMGNTESFMTIGSSIQVILRLLQ
jgi:hypothetical protein